MSNQIPPTPIHVFRSIGMCQLPLLPVQCATELVVLSMNYTASSSVPTPSPVFCPPETASSLRHHWHALPPTQACANVHPPAYIYKYQMHDSSVCLFFLLDADTYEMLPSE